MQFLILFPFLVGARTAKGPWSPGFSVALRMFVFVRFCAAMYSNIQDCDEGEVFEIPVQIVLEDLMV